MEDDSLRNLLREWKAPEAPPAMDAEMRSAYRAAYPAPPRWNFWSARVSLPVPGICSVDVGHVGVGAAVSIRAPRRLARGARVCNPGGCRRLPTPTERRRARRPTGRNIAMMTKSILWMVVLVPSALAADAGNENLHAWYADGTCVEFYSESTGSTTPTSTSGSVIVDNTNTVHRVVKDAHGNVLFAYDVVARRAAGLKDTFVVQIRPAGAAHGVGDSRFSGGEARRGSQGGHSAKSRDRREDLRRAAALRRSLALHFHPHRRWRRVRARRHADRDRRRKVSVGDGRNRSGAAARIYVPGHGAYFLSVTDAPAFTRRPTPIARS